MTEGIDDDAEDDVPYVSPYLPTSLHISLSTEGIDDDAEDDVEQDRDDDRPERELVSHLRRCGEIWGDVGRCGEE